MFFFVEKTDNFKKTKSLKIICQPFCHFKVIFNDYYFKEHFCDSGESFQVSTSN